MKIRQYFHLNSDDRPTVSVDEAFMATLEITGEHLLIAMDAEYLRKWLASGLRQLNEAVQRQEAADKWYSEKAKAKAHEMEQKHGRPKS